MCSLRSHTPCIIYVTLKTRDSWEETGHIRHDTDYTVHREELQCTVQSDCLNTLLVMAQCSKQTMHLSFIMNCRLILCSLDAKPTIHRIYTCTYSSNSSTHIRGVTTFYHYCSPLHPQASNELMKSLSKRNLSGINHRF